MSILTPELVKSILDETVASFPHEPCFTCECFLGLVAQLSIDSGPDSKIALSGYQVERREMHGCLGCDPCPPGDCYAEYMRDKRKPTLITL